VRLLRLSSFVFLTLGLFLLILFVYICFQGASLAAVRQVIFAAELLDTGVSLFHLSIGFVIIGGALAYMAARKERKNNSLEETVTEE